MSMTLPLPLFRRLLPGLLLPLLLAGCAAPRPPVSFFDLGPVPATAANAPRLTPLSVAEPKSPSWLDSQRMFYRLNYANAQQPQAYAQNRWSMAPAQLFGQRLKARFAQAGIPAVPAAAGAARIPMLRVEVDDFIQVFDSPDSSSGLLMLRATVMQGRQLIAQQSFTQSVPAPSADAAGGAAALAQASDAAIEAMMHWLAGLPLPPA